MKRFRLPVVSLALVLLMLALGHPATAATPLSAQPAADSRVVRIEHAPSSASQGQLVVAALAPAGGKHVDLYSSGGGASFAPIGRIDDPAFATAGVCCGTLYEVPQQVGGLPAGTLLWAGSVGSATANRQMATRIYASADEGRSWRFLVDVQNPTPGPVWEPEFTVGQDGALILFYSDESQSAQHSQLIRKARSYDGLNWQDSSYVVASKVQPDRPGMPVVRRLSDGRWMMTYELCGPAQCIASYRLSEDGWNWGDPADTGTPVRLPDGAFPAHTPRFTVAPGGAILLASQLIETPSLTLDPRNGRVLLENDAGDPALPWRVVAAPVPVPDACSANCSNPNFGSCSNYSPSLLTGGNGDQLLEFASEWTDNGCYTSYAWAPWQEISGALTAAILPDSRAVQLGTTATVFGVVLNAGSTDLDGCEIGLPSDAPPGLALSYQTTSAANVPTGQPNTPVGIAAGGAQNFLLGLTSTAALSVTKQRLVFDCAGSAPAPSLPGVDTVDLLFSSTPVPDVVAIAATPTGDGRVVIPYSTGAPAAFAVAAVNVGSAGVLTVETDTGSTALPLTATLCATDPTTGACRSTPATTLQQGFPANGSQTFSVFLTGGGSIPFAPATARVFLRFLDSSSVSHGSTSVAVVTR